MCGHKNKQEINEKCAIHPSAQDIHFKKCGQQTNSQADQTDGNHGQNYDVAIRVDKVKRDQSSTKDSDCKCL